MELCDIFDPAPVLRNNAAKFGRNVLTSVPFGNTVAVCTKNLGSKESLQLRRQDRRSAGQSLPTETGTSLTLPDWRAMPLPVGHYFDFSLSKCRGLLLGCI